MKRRNSTWFHVAVLATGLIGSGLAFAEDQKPDNEVSYNLAVTNDYRYRGISQTHLDPALQGGADYVNNPTGLYAGTWLSTIHWIKDAGGNDNVEVIDVSQMLLSSITRLDSAQLGENIKVVPRAKPVVVPAEEPVDTPKAESVATEDVAWLFRRMGVETGIDWNRLLEAADLAARIPGGTPGGRLRGVPSVRRAA